MQRPHSHRPRQDSSSFSEVHEYRGVARSRLLLAMIVTGSVMVIEVVGSILTGSLALASDAGHMFTHLFALIISFVAIIIACKQPCHHRTYGYYRAEFLLRSSTASFSCRNCLHLLRGSIAPAQPPTSLWF